MSRDGAPPWSDALAAALAGPLGGPVALGSARRLSGGASRQTWTVDARVGATVRGLVLQLERPGALGTSSGGMAGEADLLRAAAVAGVPVPGVVLDGDGRVGQGGPAGDGAGVGAPFLVTDRVEGETIPRRLLRDEAFAAARPRLARQAGRALAAVHRIPPTAVPRLARVDALAQSRDLLAPLGLERPALELGARWLERHRPDPVGDGVVHGDFRTGNLVVGPDGLVAVLDWELAHLGDPAEDLGWFCARAWRFGSPHRAGGFGSLEELLDGYRAAGGAEVDPAVVRWWEAVAALRWAVICAVQASAHLSGASRSVELAAIGRRVAECEEDLLELVAGPDDYEPPEPDGTTPWPSPASPTVDELLEAVGEHLDEVTAAESGRRSFQSRVAGNVVATVRRELRRGPADARRHRRRLDALGVADDAALVAAIRTGGLDDRFGEVARAVRASVRDQLAVSRPGYWNPDR